MTLNNKPRIFNGLYSDERWFFDQSESVLGPFYIMNLHKLECSNCNKFLSDDVEVEEYSHNSNGQI